MLPIANTPVSKYAAYTGSGDQAALWTVGAGQTIYLTDLIMATDGATDVTVKLGSNDVAFFSLAAAGTESHAFTAPLRGAQNEDLVISPSVAANLNVTATGYENE